MKHRIRNTAAIISAAVVLFVCTSCGNDDTPVAEARSIHPPAPGQNDIIARLNKAREESEESARAAKAQLEKMRQDAQEWEKREKRRRRTEEEYKVAEAEKVEEREKAIDARRKTDTERRKADQERMKADEDRRNAHLSLSRTQRDLETDPER